MKLINDDGSIERYHVEDDKVHHELSHDITDLVDENKRIFNANDRSYKKPMNLVARIDPYALAEWARQKGISFQEVLNNSRLLKSFINDPDNAVFKVKPGKI